MDKKRILAVDSDSKIMDSVEDLIEDSKDLEVTTFTSGKSALSNLQKNDYDLVLTAIDIGDINGMDIMNAAKEKAIPVIVLTSRVDEETVGMIMSYYKPNFYLKKPIDKMALLSTIRRVFMKKQEVFLGIPKEKIETVLQRICDSIEYGVTFLDANFNILWVNKALEDKGFKFNLVFGKKAYQIFDNRDDPDKNGPSWKALSSCEVSIGDKIGSDGHSYRITAIPIKDENGHVSCIVEFGEDLTKLKQELVK